MPLSASQLAELEGLVSQYATTLAAFETAGSAATWAGYAQVEDWYDNTQVAAAVLFAIAAANQLRQQTGGATAQFTAQVVSVMTGQPVAAVAALIEGTRTGVSPAQVWNRPVREYRDTIATGGDAPYALVKARMRSEVLAAADLMMVSRGTALAEYRKYGITGYRRVIRPELSKSGSCGLCIAASDRVYKTGLLMPMHDNCNCIPMPIVGDLDPGFKLNEGDLGRLYDDAGGNTRFDLKKTRYRVEEHGELGPVLVFAGNSRNQLTPEQAMAAKADALLSKMLPVLRDMQANPSRYPDAARAYQDDRVDQLRRLSDAA